MSADSTRPRVLMVTGAYAPETSGASLQCRNLIRALRDRADFTVLTTSTDPALPWNSVVDDTRVRRVAGESEQPHLESDRHRAHGILVPRAGP